MARLLLPDAEGTSGVFALFGKVGRSPRVYASRDRDPLLKQLQTAAYKKMGLTLAGGHPHRSPAHLTSAGATLYGNSFACSACTLFQLLPPEGCRNTLHRNKQDNLVLQHGADKLCSFLTHTCLCCGSTLQVEHLVGFVCAHYRPRLPPPQPPPAMPPPCPHPPCAPSPAPRHTCMQHLCATYARKAQALGLIPVVCSRHQSTAAC